MKRTSSRVLGLAMIAVGSLALISPASVSMVGASGGVGAQSLPDPTIHYTFDTDLSDSKGGSTLTVAPACPGNPCNSASSFGSDSNGKYWTWTSTSTTAGGGFSILTNSVIGENYTIALKFSFTQVDGWRKIIDYQNRQTDEGFYYFQGKMQYYPGRTGTEVYPVNTVLDLVIVRSNGGTAAPTYSDDTFTVYGVGSNNVLTQLIQYSDTTGDSIPYASGGKTKLGFFYDDTDFTGEATLSGKVYDLRFWSGAALSTTNLTAAATRPAAVTNVQGSPSSQTVVVSWTGVSGATEYLATILGQSCTAIAPATTCTITGLTDGASGTVQVQAIGPGGYSTPASTPSAVVVGVASSTTTTTTSTTTTVAASTTTTTAGATTTTSGPTTTLASTGSATTTTVVSRSLAAAPAATTTTSAGLAASTGSGASEGVAETTGSLPETGSDSTRIYLAWSLILVGLGLLTRRTRPNPT